MAARPARPTRRDVARQAGVAASTVSLVMNSQPRVAPATRERVQRAMAELGYTPNQAARSLSSRRSELLALVIPDLTNPFFGELAVSFDATARLAGYNAAIMCEGHSFMAIANACVERGIDALVSCNGGHGTDFVERLISARVPMATCQYELRDYPVIPAIMPDLAPGIRDAAELLAGLGHRRVGFVPGVFDPKLAVWKHELSALGARVQCVAPPCDSTPNLPGGTARVLLDSGVTAVVVTNDVAALGLLRQFSELGVAVPDAISLVGHDDIWPSAYVTPALTTVRLCASRTGREAALTAVALARGLPAQPMSVTSELVVRGSVSAPRD